MNKKQLIKETSKQIGKINDKIDIKIITKREWDKEAKVHKSLCQLHSKLIKPLNVKYLNFTFREIG